MRFVCDNKSIPVALVDNPPVGVPPLPRKRFTRTEVELMLGAGLFEGQRFELINGDLIDKMGQNPPRASGIRLCMAILVRIFGSVRVQVQLPVGAGPADQERNEPEPDLAVLTEPNVEYRKRHPNGREVTLIIEVADTSAGSDLTTKRGLYARAGVKEYWVLDLNERRLVVHRGLDESKGDYCDIKGYLEHEPVNVGGEMVPVSEMLP